jgi:hypothetical protein
LKQLVAAAAAAVTTTSTAAAATAAQHRRHNHRHRLQRRRRRRQQQRPRVTRTHLALVAPLQAGVDFFLEIPMNSSNIFVNRAIVYGKNCEKLSGPVVGHFLNRWRRRRRRRRQQQQCTQANNNGGGVAEKINELLKGRPQCTTLSLEISPPPSYSEQFFLRPCFITWPPPTA